MDPDTNKKEPIFICKNTFLEYGCDNQEAGILFKYIARVCSTVTRQVKKTFIRNRKEYKGLFFLNFVNIDEIKRCAEDMIINGSDKRTSKDKWRRILELVNAIEAKNSNKE
jgi:hypothetical protein